MLAINRKKMLTIDSMTYTILFIYIFLYTVIAWSLLAFKYNLAIPMHIMNLCRIYLFAFCIYSNRVGTKRDMLSIILFLIISIVMIFEADFKFFDIFTLALTKKRDYKKTMNVFLWSLISASTFIIGANMIGIMPQYYIYRTNGIRRYNFGFTHPNRLAFMIVILILLMLLKNYNKKNLSLHVLIFMAIPFCYYVPNSITSVIILVVLEIALVFQNIYMQIYKKNMIDGPIIKRLMLLLLPLFVIGIYFAIMNMNNSFLFDINETLWSRVIQSRVAIERYGFSLFGKDVDLVSAVAIDFGRVNSNDTFFALDCLYVYLPICYGIIPSIYFGSQFIKSLYIYIVKKNTAAVIACIVIMIYSCMETCLFEVIMSFIFICARAEEQHSVS